MLPSFKHLHELSMNYSDHFVQGIHLLARLNLTSFKLVLHLLWPDLYPDCVRDFCTFYEQTRASLPNAKTTLQDRGTAD